MDPAKLKFLRDNAKKLFDSKSYRDLFQKTFAYWEDPVIGDDVVKMVNEAVAIPKADVDVLDSLAKKYIK